MFNIIIGIITMIIYSITCYLYCRFTFTGDSRFKLNVYTCRQKYKDIFSWLWATILILVVAMDLLGKMVLYIVGKLM